MISLCEKDKKNWGVTKLIFEIKHITDNSISRSFSHLGRVWIHYYQQKFKQNGEFYLRYVCLFQAYLIEFCY